MASVSHLVLLTCIISISLQFESVQLFMGDKFEREFSETKLQNDDGLKVITVKIGDVTVKTTPTSGEIRLSLMLSDPETT